MRDNATWQSFWRICGRQLANRLPRGSRPFKNVLIIGAGSGNDVAHAPKFGDVRAVC